jgi:hypothetical protein
MNYHFGFGLLRLCGLTFSCAELTSFGRTGTNCEGLLLILQISRGNNPIEMHRTQSIFMVVATSKPRDKANISIVGYALEMPLDLDASFSMQDFNSLVL